MRRGRRKRLKKIKIAKLTLEGVLLELRKKHPKQVDWKDQSDFRSLYYLINLARKAK